jgi:hypothetical protein
MTLFSRRHFLTHSTLLFAPAGLWAASSEPTAIRWEELIPSGWKPDPKLQLLANQAFLLQDGSDKANEYMNKLREEWDRAPVVDKYNQQFVKIPGYVVSLGGEREAIKEFLLVPYFGACIHTPPPPANQIIHVQSGKKWAGIQSMDPVWVEGILQTQRQDTTMGSSGYALKASKVTLYKK